MSKSLSRRSMFRIHQQRQAYILLLLGILLLLSAWLLKTFPYPVGILCLGVGMLIAALFNPYRLMIGGILITLIGIAIYFAFKPVAFIPNAGDLLIPAIGLGLLGVALAARKGHVGAGAFTPGFIVLIVGLIEYPPAAHLLPHGYVPFLLSLWFPGLGLLVLGIIYLLLRQK